MTEERRKSNRMSIDVKIKLNAIRNSGDLNGLNKNEFNVEVINLSKDGMAFKSSEDIPIHTFYDTTVVLWTGEQFQTVVEIVRKDSVDEELILYGCRFIGIMPADQLKIQIYEMLNDRSINR